LSAPGKYTLTTESITVFHHGKTYTVQRGTGNYDRLRKAILEDNWDDIVSNLTVKSSIARWARGKFTVNEDLTEFQYEGKPLPKELHRRMMEMAQKNEDPAPVMRFWIRLMRNPSWRSVQQLYPFLKHQGCPITDDGCFLAYKAVQQNYLDVHSGTVDNSPGKINEMPRNQISDDSNVGCHIGFHVGALAYAQSFGPRDRIMLICKVDPQDVVCIPYENSFQKIRVCKYEVIGHYGGELPDTTFRDDEVLEGSAPKTEAKPVPAKHQSQSAGTSDLEDDEDIDDDEIDKDVLLPEPAPAPPVRKVERKYNKYMKLGQTELMGLPTDELRGFAANCLHIVGASKIAGGKTALVIRILEVRAAYV
jgi:hypothetical protein